MFNQWSPFLDDVEVCPVQLPARENRMREQHFGSYEALAEEVADSLTPFLDRPFVFFGHCAGALPAFETALRLDQLGAPTPRRLFVSAQVAPHDCPHDRFLDCTEDELKAELTALMAARGGQPHPMMVDLTLGVLRQDLEANRIYRRGGPVRIPSGITVLHWSDDPEVTAEQLQGWDRYSVDVAFTVLNGGHYDFLSAPPALLRTLCDSLGPDPTPTSMPPREQGDAEPGLGVDDTP